jgi:hypothetical protein
VPNVRYRTDQGAPLDRELPSFEAFIRDHEAVMMQWWGYSKEHGWVVLDRSIPSNMPARNTDLMFLRCRDAAVFIEQRARWVAPAYQFEPNYIRGLPPLEADAVAAELDRFKARWPEFEHEIQRVSRETEERAEAVRAEQEKIRKRAAAEKRKQTAAAKADR